MRKAEADEKWREKGANREKLKGVTARVVQQHKEHILCLIQCTGNKKNSNVTGPYSMVALLFIPEVWRDGGTDTGC